VNILILRPQPGADATAARARARGLSPVVAPLFEVRALPWEAPAGPYDAVMLTSANAARLAGDGMTPFLALPCYAVGEATAAAARAAGFGDVRIGPADGAALARQMAADGIRSTFHPCGADHVALAAPGLTIADTPVYAADPVAALPATAEAALAKGALVLLHSPRAAGLFAALTHDKRARVRIAAISEATAAAAGEGWRSVAVASAPRDAALLELAAKLCQTDGGQQGAKRA
jgi:uroporphyrinogen-III synthase